MVRLCNDPVLFTQEQVESICKVKNAEYVCDTEKNDVHCAVFYGDLPHPDSGSRYFALYRSGMEGHLMITDGSFIEDQEITGVVADNGDIIYSRYRHDYRTSEDKSVFVDGGRAYLRSSVLPEDRYVKLTVHKGRMEVWFNEK